MSTRLEQRRLALTAATTLKYPFHQGGLVLTNRGATGSVTVTLPAPSTCPVGLWYEGRVHADQSFIFASPSAGQIVAPGNVTADNVGFQIASKKIGRGLKLITDGTSWYAFPWGALDGFCINGTELAPTLGSGTVLTTPTINGGSNSALKSAFSTATVAGAYAADTYLVGSGIAMPAGGFVAGARYRCRFDMVKTAAGTATFVAVVRIGTLGTTGDAAILTFTFTAGTAAVDTGTFEIVCHFRTVGSGTSAVLVGIAELRHALAATGLTQLGASGQAQVSVVSSGFDSTIAGTTIGVSVNGGASFSGTTSLVEAELRSY